MINHNIERTLDIAIVFDIYTQDRQIIEIKKIAGRYLKVNSLLKKNRAIRIILQILIALKGKMSVCSQRVFYVLLKRKMSLFLFLYANSISLLIVKQIKLINSSREENKKTSTAMQLRFFIKKEIRPKIFSL